MRRRDFLLGSAALAAPFAARAQQRKAARVAFLGVSSASESALRIDALRAGLRALGYVEGGNLALEYRWAAGNYERMPALAAELVALKPDVLLGQGVPGTLAARGATKTIPIVMVAAGDAGGLYASLARPGGNVTGTINLTSDLAAKRLSVLKEAMPPLARVAVLLNPDNEACTAALQAMEKTAKALKLKLEPFEVRTPQDFDAAFSGMPKARVGAVAVLEDGVLTLHARELAERAAKARIASIGIREFGAAGGLIGYGHDIVEQYRRTAYFVDRILKGAQPSELPIERPAKIDLLINLKTAKALGLTLPRSLVVRADEVIE